MTDAPVSDDDPTTRHETDLDVDDAAEEISHAVKGRRSIARKYVLRLRRRHPDASPAEIISLLERHYTTSITTAGSVLAVGGLAATVAIALIPGGGVASTGAKSIGQHAVKRVTKHAVKATAKKAALGAATVGATKVASLLPAGDKQLQFEITAIYALALADIHGMDLDDDQAHALVYGLSNEHVTPQQIGQMAKDVAETTADGTPDAGRGAALSPGGGTHWANTLADSLPAGGGTDPRSDDPDGEARQGGIRPDRSSADPRRVRRRRRLGGSDSIRLRPRRHRLGEEGVLGSALVLPGAPDRPS